MAWLQAVPPAGRPFYAGRVETLTFLFTDIEGSTALLGRLGDDVYAQVLARHHALIRSALAAHGGGCPVRGTFAILSPTDSRQATAA